MINSMQGLASQYSTPFPLSRRGYKLPGAKWATGCVQRTSIRRFNGIVPNDYDGQRMIRSHSLAQNGSHLNDSITSGPTLVWFKNDLRITDHPGLQQAVKDAADVVPVYCLDPMAMSGILETQGGVELLWGALCNLKKNLRGLGSDLLFRVGSAGPVVHEIASAMGASRIITEDSFDWRWQEAIDHVEAQGEVPVTRWKTSIWDDGDFNDNYQTYRSTRGRASLPLELVSSLPSVQDGLDMQDIPSVEDLKRILEEAKSICSDCEEADPFGRAECKDAWMDWVTQCTAGPEAAVACLRQYLLVNNASQESEGTVLESLVETLGDEKLPSLAFPALFYPLLSLGVLSLREVYTESMKVADNLPWTKVFGSGSSPVEVAIDEVEAVNFHRGLAQSALPLKSEATLKQEVIQQFWDWQGLAMEFTVSYPDTWNADTPVVLMIHGFGASSFHWRRNAQGLRESGHIVYCLTLPGFGRSQKPSMRYSQFVWRPCVRDFIQTVIRKQVTIVGNSIGGYVTASLVGFHGELVKGAVLMNSAGPVKDDYSLDDDEAGTPPSEVPPRFAQDLFAWATLTYLKLQAPKILKNVYPANPSNADDELASDILRAASDPNVEMMMKSVFYLRNPVPLNYLLSDMFGGPVLILQGRLDPLGTPVKKGADLERLCPNAKVKYLPAGHCPHDELPDEVNREIAKFVQSLDVSLPKQVAETVSA